MRYRPGQIVPFLLAVLVAVAILVLMNVNVFLSVRAKNHATAAGDAAALAVARYQGELLNAIGRNNIATLKAALADDLAKCEELERDSREKCFLGPLRGIGVGNRAAIAALSDVERGGGSGAETFLSGEMRGVFERLVSDVRNFYADNTSLYPEPWEGAWEPYAETLQTEIAGDFVVGPDNAELATAYESEPLLDGAFYNAIAGRQWCWFKLYGMMWVFDRTHNNMPRPVFRQDRVRDNCEIYPLHLAFRSLPTGLDGSWRKIIRRLTGCSEKAIGASHLLASGRIKCAFFDDRWSPWSGTGFNMDEFPIVGPVKDEYDVLGCAAVCRVRRSVSDLTGDDAGHYNWTAAAKPFGTVRDLDGETAVVTALNGLVTPCFTDVRLIPIDAANGANLNTADPDWMAHVRDHLLGAQFGYFVVGPSYYAARGCWYCQQLNLWETVSFRSEGQTWLKFHSSECRRPTSGGRGGHGGTAHAH